MSDKVSMVTGATGFVRSHLLSVLLEQGEVVASDISGPTHDLEEVLGRIKFERTDIGSFSEVLRLVEKYKPTTIYWIGAMRGPQCDERPAAIYGRPYAIYVAPRSRVPIIHVKDAVRALIELAAAPADAIKTVNYNVLGPTPTPSAQELVDTVKAKIPAAALKFEINEDFQKLLDTNIVKPFDDSRARSEWGWKSRLNLDAIVEDFIANKT